MSAVRHTPAQLLPHRAPMLLLDAIDSCTTERATARVAIARESPFFSTELDGVPAWVGLEYMAQTVAAWGGARRLARGEALVAGLLLGSRHYHCNSDLFPLHSALTIDIELLFEDDDGLGAFACELRGNSTQGHLISATARLSALNPRGGALPCRTTEQLLTAGATTTDQE